MATDALELPSFLQLPPILTTSSNCLNCRREAKDLKHCSRCKIASYCSQDCQKAGFDAHKRNCKAVSRLKVENNRIMSLGFYSTRGSSREYTWPFVRGYLHAEVDEMFTQFTHRRRDYVYGYMIALKEAAILEGNMEAAQLYVLVDWIFRHGAPFPIENISDVPLFLFVLGRWEEGRNFMKKVFLEMMEISSLPETPREEFYTSSELDEFRESLGETPSLGRMATVAFLVLLCYGAGQLVLERAAASAFEATADAVYDEILNDDSRLKKLRGLDGFVHNILKMIEGGTKVGMLMDWTVQQARILHELNDCILGGILDPARVGVGHSDNWLAAYKKCVASKTMPRKWADERQVGSLEAKRLDAKAILLSVMPLCSLLPGMEDAIKEVASEVVS